MENGTMTLDEMFATLDKPKIVVKPDTKSEFMNIDEMFASVAEAVADITRKNFYKRFDILPRQVRLLLSELHHGPRSAHVVLAEDAVTLLGSEDVAVRVLRVAFSDQLDAPRSNSV